MNWAKELLIHILASDPRIRNYNKNPTPENAEKCIKAYQEAVIEFCKKFDYIMLECKCQE